MEATMFTLVTTEDRTSVYALGLWIRATDGTQEAVTYRRDPRSGQTMFSVFGSPEAACTRLSMIVPLSVDWPDNRENGPIAPPTIHRVCRDRTRLRPR